jgi:TetR/AcrR family transcriptional regulator
MARTGGDQTRKRILEAAERLFAQGGFHATSVDRIARAAGVNKALIYYHFTDKSALVEALFTRIMEEAEAHGAGRPAAARAAAGRPAAPGSRKRDRAAGVAAEVRDEVEFLRERRRIIAVLLAEALHGDDRDDFLFRCAALGIEREHGGEAGRPGRGGRRLGPAEQRRRVHEFFTGFVPLAAFVTLGDKWCDFVGGDRARLVDDFVAAFARSHVASHDPE